MASVILPKALLGVNEHGERPGLRPSVCYNPGTSCLYTLVCVDRGHHEATHGASISL